MSVRKLAVATLRRVKKLRKSLAEKRGPLVRGLAITAGIFLVAHDGSVRAGDGEHFPLRDPFAFDPDFRWFEPVYDADLADMQPRKRANTGWYGSYDRMELWLSRPEAQSSEWLLDHGSGNRYDLGYMLDKDHGWSMTYMGYNVDAFDGVNRERLNRYNLPELEGEPEPAGPPWGRPVPESDANNFGYNNRFVEIRNSENVADFHSFELNKTWRLEPYHYGGMLEPLVGVRYMRFSDTYQRMTYDAGFFPYPEFESLPPPWLPDEVTTGELVRTERSSATNDMIGGQLGFRYFKFVDRFRYSAELRVFSLANFQSNRQQTSEELTLYDDSPIEIGEPPIQYIERKDTPMYGRNDEFAFGYDIRTEVSYTLTRMVELRGGFQMIDIAQGLWRGRLSDAHNPTDQRGIMAGFTFGVALNR